MIRLFPGVGASGGPSGTASGDLDGPYPAPAVVRASKSFALSSVLNPTAFATTQNDYDPEDLATASTLRLSTTADAAITGLAGGTPGRLITAYNVGAFKISLNKQSTSSTPENRFAVDNDVLLLPDTAVILQYDATSMRWRVAGAGSAVPTLLPAPKFFRVALDTSTTQQPPSWATLLSGSFTLASSELNLIVLLSANLAASNASRRIEIRVLINGTSVGGSGGSTSAADLPFTASFTGQVLGVAGTNTFEIQWRVNSNTAFCRPVSFPDGENASLAIWSSAAP